jgi:hypothetical protein
MDGRDNMITKDFPGPNFGAPSSSLEYHLINEKISCFNKMVCRAQTRLFKIEIAGSKFGELLVA